MRIQFTDSVAGARFAYRCGEKADLRIDIARAFVKAGQAVPIADEPETAVANAVETTAKRTGGKRRTIRNLGGLLPG